MKRALVTGSNGFSGGYLMRYLQSFNALEVFGSDLSGDTVHCDLLEPSAVDRLINKIRPDYIIHLAGLNKCNDYKPFFNINLFAPINLMEAMAHNKLWDTRLLLISSAAVYGRSFPGDVKEESPLRPVTFYGNSKLSMENAALQFVRNYGLKINIARPFNLIGPGQPATLVVPIFLKRLLQIKKKEGPPVMRVGNLAAIRDFVDIRDAIRAYWEIVNTDLSGEIFNIGSGIPTRIEDVLKKLIRLLDIDVEIQPDKQLFQAQDIPRQVADIVKILQLGWSPRITLDTSLASMVEERFMKH